MAAPFVTRAALPRTAAIGDGRWARGRWWDFGATRIRYGADRALAEGLELGEQLQRGGPHALGRFAAERRSWPAGCGEARPTDPRLCLVLLLTTLLAAVLSGMGLLLSAYLR